MVQNLYETEKVYFEKENPFEFLCGTKPLCSENGKIDFFGSELGLLKMCCFPKI